jgi:hypothetical protein
VALDVSGCARWRRGRSGAWRRGTAGGGGLGDGGGWPSDSCAGVAGVSDLFNIEAFFLYIRVLRDLHPRSRVRVSGEKVGLRRMEFSIFYVNSVIFIY